MNGVLTAVDKAIAWVYSFVAGTTLKPLILKDFVCTGSLNFALNLYLPIAAASIGLLVFIYLIGKVVENKRLELYMKVELYEIFYFALALTVIFPFLLGLNCLDLFGYGGNTSVYEAGQRFWELLDVNLAISGYFMQLSSLMFASALTTNLQSGRLQGNLQGLWTMVDAIMTTSISSIVMGLVMSHAMSFLYTITTYGFLKYLFPLGLLLRAFPPFRKIGGTLVGLAIAMTFFLPLISATFFTAINGSLPVNYNVTTKNLTISADVFQAVKAVSESTGDKSVQAISKEHMESINKGLNDYYVADTGRALQNSEFLYQPTVVSGKAGTARFITSVAFAVGGVMSTLSALTSSLEDFAFDRVRRGCYIRYSADLNAQRNCLKAADSWENKISVLSFFITLIVFIAFAYLFMPSLVIAVGSIGIMLPVLITSVKLFTGMFGEPLDVGNLTRLV